MCLSTVFTKQEMEDFLSTQPDVISVKKLITKAEYKYEASNGNPYAKIRWMSPFTFVMINEGENTVDYSRTIHTCDGDEYPVGFHSILATDTLYFQHNRVFPNDRVVEATVRKTDIVAVGLEILSKDTYSTIIVSSKITYTKLPEL